MVAIVAGSGLGLFNTSLGLLGNSGVLGQAASGRSGERVYVNASTGNLVVQQQDEWLVGVGPDSGVLRTYNSLATADGDNNDNWRLGFSRRVQIAGADVIRTGEDGVLTTFVLDAASGLYIAKDGAGAFDTMAYNSATNQITWTDGATQRQEVYEADPNASGQWRLLKVTDPTSGKSLTLGYTGALITSVDTSNGERVVISYDGSNIQSITTFYKENADGTGAIKAIARVSYEYNNNRLSRVKVDLTPLNTADTVTYVTDYTYVDATSKRLASITQTDGSQLTFTYTGDKIQTVTDAQGVVTTFTYGTGKTTVTTTSGTQTQTTEVYFETLAGQNQNQLKETRLLNGQGTVIQSNLYGYDGSGNVQTVQDGRGNVTTYGYDAYGNRNYERDAFGNVVSRVFSTDRKNLLLNETVYTVADPDAGGAQQPSGAQTTRYVYDAQNNLRFVVSAEGRVTEHRYENSVNGAGQRTSTIQYQGNRYNVSGLSATTSLQLSSLTAWLASTSTPVDKANAQRVDFNYDFRGQLNQQITYTSLDASGNGVVSDLSQTVVQYVYDQAGNLLQTIDSRGDELATRDTSWAQTIRGQLGVSATAANLTDQQRSTLRGFFSTVYQYDGLNRLTLQTDALGNTAQTVYADGARQTTVVQANGLWTVNTYDKAGRLLSSNLRTAGTENFGTTTYTYDALGQLRVVTTPASASDAAGGKTYYLYDDAGRKVGQIDREGALTETVYNGNNQVVRTIRYATRLDTSLVPGDGTTLTLAMVKPFVQSGAAEDRVQRTIYDKAGQVSRTIDAQGAVVDYTYDGVGRLVKTKAYATVLTSAQVQALVTAEASAELTLANSTVQTNSQPPATADDRVSNRYYDQDGLLVGTLDGDNYFTKYSYNDAGKLSTVVRYAGVLQNAASLGAGLPTAYSSAQSGAYILIDSVRDQTTTYLYNAKGLQVGVIDAGDYLTETTYDTAGNKLSEIRYANTANRAAGRTVASVRPTTSTEDRKTYFAYDRVGRLSSTESQPDSVFTSYVYNAVGQLLQTTVSGAGGAQSRTTQRRYDAAGRVTSELSGQGSASVATAYATWLAANPSANQAAKDAQTETLWATYGTRYTYDTAGRLVSKTTPDGSGASGLKTIYYYDGEGRLVYSINALGEVSKTAYNAFGELIESGRYSKRLATPGQGGLAKTLTASLAGTFTSSYEVDLQSTYNRIGRAELVTPANGAQSFSAYNAFGELASQIRATSAGQAMFTQSYDHRGFRLIGREDVGGIDRLTQTAYDAFGRPVTSIDANGNTITRGYDRLGREVTVYDAAATALYTLATYDAFGRILSFTDKLQAKTTYAYDTANRKLTVTTPEGVQTITESNVHGQVVKVTVKHKDMGAAGVDSLQRITTYEYDASGQVTAITVGQGSAAQSITRTEYDNGGRVYKTKDGRGTTTQTSYDAASRVMKRVVDPGGLNLVTEYFYDAKGQSVWVKDPAGTWTQTQYDAKGRVTAVTVDPRQIPNTALAYGASTPLDLSTLVANPSVGGGLAIRTEYSYDATGQVVTQAEGVDATASATSVTRYANARITNYVYDALGRRVEEIIDPLRTPLAGAGADDNIDGLALRTRYTYDKNNNVIAKMDAMGSTTRYIYNANNQLTHTIDATGAVTQNTYDANGRLTQTRRYANRLQQDQGLRVWYREGTDSFARKTVGSFLAGDVVTVTVRYKTTTNAVAGLVIANAAFSNPAVALQNGSRDADGWQTLTVTYTVAQNEDLFVYLGGDRGGIGSNDSRNVVYDDLSVSSVKKGPVLTDTFSTVSVNNPLVVGSYSVSGLAEQVEYVKLDPSTVSNAQILNQLAALSSETRDELSTYIYNNDGQLTQTVDALNFVTERKYDAAGNVVRQVRYATAVTTPTVAQVSGDFKRFSVPTPTVSNTQDRVEQYFYDAANRKTVSLQTDFDIATGSWTNYATKYTYDANGNVTGVRRYDSASNPGLTTTNYANVLKGINAEPTLTSSTVDRYTNTVYDAANRAIFSMQWVYSPLAGLHALAPVSQGYLTQNDYDNAGRLVKVRQYAFGMSGVLGTANALPSIYRNGSVIIGPTTNPTVTATQSDVDDAITQYEYDRAGRLVLTTDAEGIKTRNTYQGTLLTDVTLAADTGDASTTHYGYDGAGRVVAERRGYVAGAALGSATAETRYVLDGLGNRLFIVDPRGAELAESDSSWAQATRQRLVKDGVLDSSYLANASTFTQAQRNRLLAQYTTVREYDALGRVVRSRDALGAQTTTQYDAFGNAVKVTDPNGNSGYYYFNLRNEVILQVDPAMYALSTAYDAFGQVASTTRHPDPVRTKGPLSTVTPPQKVLADIPEAQWPAEGHLVLVPADQRITMFFHNLRGLQTKITDAMGFSEYIAYDAFGSESAHLGKSNTANVADAGGLTTFLTDGRGKRVGEKLAVQVYQYDENGLVVKDAAGQPVLRDVFNAFLLDGLGNERFRIEALGLKEQRITSYSYDKVGRVKSTDGEAIAIGTPKETRRYDNRGNVVEVTTASGAKTFTYWDALNRKVAEYQDTTDASGQANGSWTTYEYDAAGNVVKQRSFGTLIARPTGNARPADPAGLDVREIRSLYDANNRLLQTIVPNITYGEINAATGNYEINTKDLVTQRFYDANGNLVEEVDARGKSTFHYYDEVGNRVATVNTDRYATFWQYEATGKVIIEYKSPQKVPDDLELTVDLDWASLAMMTDGRDARSTMYLLDKLGRVTAKWVYAAQVSAVDSQTGAVVEPPLPFEVTGYEYNGLGNITKKTVASGEYESWSFDKQGREKSHIGAEYADYEGVTVKPQTDTEYNALGMSVRVLQRGKDATSESDDRITRYTYGANGLLLRTTDAAGGVLNYEYNLDGRMVRQTQYRYVGDYAAELGDAYRTGRVYMQRSGIAGMSTTTNTAPISGAYGTGTSFVSEVSLGLNGIGRSFAVGVAAAPAGTEVKRHEVRFIQNALQINFGGTIYDTNFLAKNDTTYVVEVRVTKNAQNSFVSTLYVYEKDKAFDSGLVDARQVGATAWPSIVGMLSNWCVVANNAVHDSVDMMVVKCGEVTSKLNFSQPGEFGQTPASLATSSLWYVDETGRINDSTGIFKSVADVTEVAYDLAGREVRRHVYTTTNDGKRASTFTSANDGELLIDRGVGAGANWTELNGTQSVAWGAGTTFKSEVRLGGNSTGRQFMVGLQNTTSGYGYSPTGQSRHAAFFVGNTLRVSYIQNGVLENDAPVYMTLVADTTYVVEIKIEKNANNEIFSRLYVYVKGTIPTPGPLHERKVTVAWSKAQFHAASYGSAPGTVGANSTDSIDDVVLQDSSNKKFTEDFSYRSSFLNQFSALTLPGYGSGFWVQDAIGSSDRVYGVTTETAYNSYGEAIAKGRDGGWQESAQYDGIGQLVRAVGSDGVPRIYVNDANGHTTLTLSPPADGQTAAEINALFKSTYPLTSADIRTLLNAGCRVVLSAYTAQGLLTDTYEAAASQVLASVNAINATMGGGTPEAYVSYPTGQALATLATGQGVSVSFKYYSSIYSEWVGGGSKNDRTIRSINDRFEINLSKSSLPGSKYLVVLDVDRGHYAASRGWGSVNDTTQSFVVDATGNLNFGLHQFTRTPTGDYRTDYGGVYGVNFKVKVYKLTNDIDATQRTLVAELGGSLPGLNLPPFTSMVPTAGKGLSWDGRTIFNYKEYSFASVNTVVLAAAGSVTTPSQGTFTVSSLPSDTDKAVLQYRIKGQNPPVWNTAVVPYVNGQAVFGEDALRSLGSAAVPTGSGNATALEFNIHAFKADGTLLTSQAGQVGVYRDNASSPSYYYGSIIASPKAVEDRNGQAFWSAGKLNYVVARATDKDSVPPQSAQIRFRKVGDVNWGAAITVPAATLSGVTIPGWFQVAPPTPFVAGQAYEYIIDVKSGPSGSGATTGSFSGFITAATGTIGGASYQSYKTTVPISASRRPSLLQFSNVPAGTTQAQVTYKLYKRVWTDVGGAPLSLGRVIVEHEGTVALSLDANGNYSWDAAVVGLDPAGQYSLDYTFTALNASNIALGTVSSRQAIRVGSTLQPFKANIYSPSAASSQFFRISSPTVKITHSSDIAQQVRSVTVYYRRAGSGTSYTAINVPVTVNAQGAAQDVSFDLTAQMQTNADYTDFEVYYVYKNANNQPILGYAQANGEDVGPTEYFPVLLRLLPQASFDTGAGNLTAVILGLTKSAAASHRTQVYNAFGQVVQEFSANAVDRIRKEEASLGRELTSEELERYGTTLTYDAAGRLMSKTTPAADATQEDGFVLVGDRSTTQYGYDIQGRLIWEQDANGKLTTYVLLASADGRRLASHEFRPDASHALYGYDIFGDLRRKANGTLAVLSDYSYDGMGRLVRMDQPASVSGKRAGHLYFYDAVGNRVAHRTSPDEGLDLQGTFGIGRVYSDRTEYDALGQVIKTVSADGLQVSTTSTLYTGNLWARVAIDENGKQSYELRDYAGRVMRRIDLGGHSFKYEYNLAGNLVRQYQVYGLLDSPAIGGQDIRYGYYKDGTVRYIDDYTLNTSTTYTYDKNGNKIFEGYQKRDGSFQYQATTVTYDALDRMVTLQDPRFSLAYEYDKVGNRRYLEAVQTSQAGTETIKYWYAYDALNRIVVSMGQLDGNGQRSTTATTISRITQGTSGKGVRLGYDASGNRQSAQYAEGNAQEYYTYGADGYLTTVTKGSGGAQISKRTNDLLGRVTLYEQNNPDTYIASQRYTYDADGRTTKSESWSSKPSSDSTVTNNSYVDLVTSKKTSLLQTTETITTPGNNQNGVTRSYTKNLYEYFDSAQQSQIRTDTTNTNIKEASWGRWADGVSQFFYDANGHIKSVKDSKDNTGTNLRDIRFITNAQGLILNRTETGTTAVLPSQTYFYLDGKRVAEWGNNFGMGSVNYSEALARSVDDGNAKDRYRNLTPIRSDFDQNYQPINATYPAFTPGGYTVRQGDTLETVARAVWGDATLWYLLADANGIANKNALRVGQTLIVPNKVTNVHNTSETSRVYNPGEIMGDVSPTTPDAPTPPPPKDASCGPLASIIMVVVAVIVTIYTAGAAAGAMGLVSTGAAGATASTFSLGMSVMAGQVAAVGAGGALVAATGTAMMAAAIGGAVGSIASQAVGMATGMQQGFSWKGVALGAIGSSVGAGLANVGFGFGSDLSSFGNTVARSAAGNAITQGVGVATGLQQKFDWRGVAASAVGAAASWGATEAIGQMQYDDWGSRGLDTQIGQVTRTAIEKDVFGNVLRGTLSGMANGAAKSLVFQRRPDWGALALDSFGNALGDAIVGQIAAKQVAQAQDDPEVMMQWAAQKRGLDLKNDRDRRILAYDLGYGDDYVSRAERFASAVESLGRRGATAEEINEITQAWKDAGFKNTEIIGVVTLGDIGAPEGAVSEPESQTPKKGAYLGVKPVDEIVIAGGRIANKFKNSVNESRVAQYAMEGAAVLLGGVPRYLASKAFEETSVGEAVRDFSNGVQDAVTNKLQTGFEGVGYSTADARDGATGTTTTLAMAGSLLLGKLLRSDPAKSLIRGKENIASFKNLNEARSSARKLSGLGDDAIDFVQEIGPLKGQVTGRASPDGLRGWRLDFDTDKGFHVNWWDHTAGPKRADWLYGANKIEGGTLDHFQETLQHFPKN